jgi:hypothetical protein
MARIHSPGIRAIIQRLGAQGPNISAKDLLDGCLEMLGGYQLEKETRQLLLGHSQAAATLHTGTEEFAHAVGQLLQLIVSTQEYQFG